MSQRREPAVGAGAQPSLPPGAGPGPLKLGLGPWGVSGVAGREIRYYCSLPERGPELSLGPCPAYIAHQGHASSPAPLKLHLASPVRCYAPYLQPNPSLPYLQPNPSLAPFPFVRSCVGQAAGLLPHLTFRVWGCRRCRACQPPTGPRRPSLPFLCCSGRSLTLQLPTPRQLTPPLQCAPRDRQADGVATHNALRSSPPLPFIYNVACPLSCMHSSQP